MLKLSIGATSLLLAVLFLASCGQKQDYNGFGSGQYTNSGPATPAKPISMPSEATLNFSLDVDKPNVQLNYAGQNLTECQLGIDPVQNRLFFSVGFQDASLGSSISMKFITDHSDIGGQPLSDTKAIFGDGENSGTVSVILGAKGLPFTNRDLTPNVGKLKQSTCNITYTLADSMIKGKLFCSDLMTEKGESTSGLIKFSCAVAQVPRAQGQPISGVNPDRKL